ncbi:MAG: endonuclease Q family protein [Candidatus Hodarchaeales archaeon]
MVDLHCHSAFAGGAGALAISPENLQKNIKVVKKRFQIANQTSMLKGLDILGTGDIQFKPWLNFVKEYLEEYQEGLFKYKHSSGESNLRYVLQTEIIFTTKIRKGRKTSHTVVLFPDFESIHSFRELLTSLNVKIERIARPFVTLESPTSVSEICYKIQEINELIEIIPAHVMTPEGVYGGGNGVNRLKDFYGEYEEKILAVETGLSADPHLLALIQELDNRTLLSNSDAHSTGLHRIGREFTVLNLKDFTYSNLISAIRDCKIEYSLEFPPTEGRYFFTGHRAGRKKPGKHGKNEYCYFSPDKVPDNNTCPICSKKLTVGVIQRAFDISETQGRRRTLDEASKIVKQSYLHGVPLVEVIALSLGIKSPTSKRVLKTYEEVVKPFETEVNLWKMSIEDVNDVLKRSNIISAIKKAIAQVKKDNFCFYPPGFDGQYGELHLGEKVEYLGHSMIVSEK